MAEQTETGLSIAWRNDAEKWPTNCGSAAFWEELGRTVATFGYLEDTIPRALYSVTGQRPAGQEEEWEARLQAWGEDLEKDVSDTLKPLATKLENAWKEFDGELSEHHSRIIHEIRELAKERNRLCHGMWIHADDGDEGIVRYFTRGEELARSHRAGRSIRAITKTRERTTTVVKQVIEDTVARTGKPFPGMPGERRDA